MMEHRPSGEHRVERFDLQAENGVDGAGTFGALEE
jgi:hypothetical protein